MIKNLLFLLFCSQIFSQTVQLKGTLLDKDSNKPIVYANISFLEKNMGISSLEDGTFNLEINKKLLQEKVHISCLNYKDTIVLAENLLNKTLYLKAKSFELKEIIISKKIDREFVINKIRKKDVKIGFIAVEKKPWTIAKFFKYQEEYNFTPYLKGAKIYLSDHDRRKAKFRIRIFSNDSVTNLPKDDLLLVNLIIGIDKKDKWIYLDLSKYNLEIPKNGLFIGLERINIPYNFYEDTFNYKDSISEKVTRVAPNFGGIEVLNEKLYSYNKGKWFALENEMNNFKGKTVVPAISLTLSN